MGQWIKSWVVPAAVMLLAGMTLGLVPEGLNVPNRGLFLAFLFGASLGTAEIVSRYRDEPVKALLTPYGALYWFLNGMLGIWGLLIVWRFPEKFSLGFQPRDSAFLSAVLAGFGASTIMRARLVVLKDSAGKDQTFGPDIVLKTLLEVVDIQIDRNRASSRWRFLELNFATILRIYRGFGEDFGRTADALLASLYAYQNLSSERRQALAEVAKVYADASGQAAGVPVLVRLMALSFAMISVAGERNFGEVLGFMDTQVGGAKPTP